MTDYTITREGNKLTVVINPSVPTFESVEIIDGLQELVTDYIDESLYGPIEEDLNFDDVDEYFQDREEFDDPVEIEDDAEDYVGDFVNN